MTDHSTRQAAIAAIIEAAMDNALDGDTSAAAFTAANAVIEAIKPKPLVWEEERGDNYIIYRAVCPASKVKYVAGTDRNGDSYWACDILNRDQEIESGGWEAAQSVAQAHADAGHWSNTPLGELVGATKCD